MLSSKFILTKLAVLIAFIILNLLLFVPQISNIQYQVDSLQSHEISLESFNVDFLAPSPRESQINEMIELQHISELYPFLYTKRTFNFNENNTDGSLFIYEKDTDFINLLNIDSSLGVNDNTMEYSSSFIDSVFAVENGIQLADIIRFSINNQVFSYQVAGFYIGNEILGDYDVMVELNENIEDAIFSSNSKTYSGVFIKSNSLQDTETFLRSYKPLGRLPIDATQPQVDSFMSNDFWIEIGLMYETRTLSLLSISSEISLTKKQFVTWVLLDYFILFLILFTSILIGLDQNFIKKMRVYNVGFNNLFVLIYSMITVLSLIFLLFSFNILEVFINVISFGFFIVLSALFIVVPYLITLNLKIRRV